MMKNNVLDANYSLLHVVGLFMVMKPSDDILHFAH